MAIYEGSQGIRALKAKIAMKSKKLVGESLEKIAVMLVDESPLGAPFYASTQGAIQNDVGDLVTDVFLGVDESVEVVEVSKYEGFGEACMWRVLCVSV